jgi:3',5'-cyclic AMP phosphodiesterase CpdA
MNRPGLFVRLLPVSGATLLIVSDSHLSPQSPGALSNWKAICRYARHTAPNLVLHLGDLTRDGINEATEIDYARRLLDELPSPWLAIPGNHDVPDPSDKAPYSRTTIESKNDRWRRAIGRDYWRLDLGEWTILGLNTQLLSCSSDSSEDHWRWLEREIVIQTSDRALMIMSHKPIQIDEGIRGAPVRWFVRADVVQRIRAMVGERRISHIMSGHLHQFRVTSQEEVHVWAPSTWAVFPDRVQRTVGLKVCGAVSVELQDRSVARIEMVEPEGLSQLSVTQETRATGG